MKYGYIDVGLQWNVVTAVTMRRANTAVWFFWGMVILSQGNIDRYSG